MANKKTKSTKPDISPLMHKVSSYIAAAPHKALPAAVTERSKRHLLDTLASMVSGSRLRPGRLGIAYAKSLGGRPQSAIIGTSFVTTAVTAALVNGVLAHADETDDSHVGTSTHPGCAIVPAALAVAEYQKRSGTDLLRAVALGYDIGARMSLSLGPLALYRSGHSSHSVAGSFGAAAAAAALFRLDQRGVRHTLSYAAQQASGVSVWMRDPDHIEKAFDFAGMPARNGVTAALFPAQGWTGVDDVFAGERNFIFAFGGTATADKLVHELGRRYEMMNTQIKKWCVGSPILAPLSSTEILKQQHKIKADTIDSIVVTIDDINFQKVDNRKNSDTCLQHLVALMLLDGEVTFASAHNAARMHDPKVLALRKRIHFQASAKLSKIEPIRQGIVEITLRNGQKLRHHTVSAKGMPDNPMSRKEIDAKAMDLMAPVLTVKRARKAVDTILAIDKLKDVRRLRTLLAP